jgi:hypothetical protein
VSRNRPSGKLAAARVWALPVVWLWRREPDPQQVIVVFVDAATGTVIGATPRAAVTTGTAVRALPAADGTPLAQLPRHTHTTHPFMQSEEIMTQTVSPDEPTAYQQGDETPATGEEDDGYRAPGLALALPTPFLRLFAMAAAGGIHVTDYDGDRMRWPADTAALVAPDIILLGPDLKDEALRAEVVAFSACVAAEIMIDGSPSEGRDLAAPDGVVAVTTRRIPKDESPVGPLATLFATQCGCDTASAAFAIRTTGDEESAPAVPEHRECPPWCEIEDHDDYGSERHACFSSVDMTFYPYDVTTTESGTRVTAQYYDDLSILRVQVGDGEPAIAIEPPGTNADCAAPAGLADPSGCEAILTFAEAQEAAIALLVMTSREDRSSHAACTPGDPAPCCPDSPLGASAYPSAVFCPSCGSLYRRR